MDAQRLLQRLRDDDDRWDGLYYREPVGRPQSHASPWRRLAIAVVAGLAVGVVAATVIVGVRGSQQFVPSVSTSSPAADPTEATPTPTPDPTESFDESSEPLPGSAVVTALSEPLTQAFTGTSVVALGARPASSTGFSYRFTCVSAGHFAFPGGEGESCSEADVHDARAAQPISNVYKLAAGVDTVTVTATAGARWTIETTWVESHLSPLGVNADGQTYGVAGTGLHPTLIATYASNGRSGYSYSKDHHGYNSGCSTADPAEYAACQEKFAATIPPITVYLSDGKTVIGHMITDAGTSTEHVITPTPESTP